MWEGVVDRTELQHIDPYSSGHYRVSFSFSWLFNRGPGNPASLGHVPQSSIFSPTRLISNSSDLQTTQSGAWGLPLLGAGFLYRILSPTRLIPNWLIGGLRAPSVGCWLFLPHLVSNWSGLQNWLNFLCTELHNTSTPTFLWASQIALIQPIHSQGYTLLFLDWMHLLFTLVHFLFWQPGWVVGQYTTNAIRVVLVYTQLKN